MEVKTKEELAVSVPSLFIPGDTGKAWISHTRYQLPLRSWKPSTLRSITDWQN